MIPIKEAQNIAQSHHIGLVQKYNHTELLESNHLTTSILQYPSGKLIFNTYILIICCEIHQISLSSVGRNVVEVLNNYTILALMGELFHHKEKRQFACVNNHLIDQLGRPVT